MRVQILIPVGILDRPEQLGVVQEMTELVAATAGDPGLSRPASQAGHALST